MRRFATARVLILFCLLTPFLMNQMRYGMRYQETSYFITKVTSVTLVIFLIIAGCNSYSQPAATLTRIDYIVQYPVVQFPGPELKVLRDTLPVYYYNDYVVYGVPYRSTLQKDTILIREEKKYAYFFFRKNRSYGFYFNSLHDTCKGQRLPVDSFLFKRAFATKFEFPVDSLLSTSTDTKNNFVLEKYVPKKYYGEHYFDSMYCYYTNSLDHVEFSLSKKIDSAKRIKLFRVRLLYNEKLSPTVNAVIPKREFLFEFRENRIVNAAEIIDFFNRAQKCDSIL